MKTSKTRTKTPKNPPPPQVVTPPSPLVVEIRVTVGADRASVDLLQQIGTSLIALHGKVEKFMAVTKQQFDELIAAFNSETNAIASRIEALKQAVIDAIAASGGSLTADQEQALFSEFSAVSARLTALGADAEAPIPPADDNPPVPAGT